MDQAFGMEDVLERGGSRHYIEFPGDFSTRKILAEMILVADGFFFSHDEE